MPEKEIPARDYCLPARRLQIIRALRDAGSPLTSDQIVSAIREYPTDLESPVANTIQSILKKMHREGLLERQGEERKYTYRAGDAARDYVLAHAELLLENTPADDRKKVLESMLRIFGVSNETAERIISLFTADPDQQRNTDSPSRTV